MSLVMFLVVAAGIAGLVSTNTRTQTSNEFDADYAFSLLKKQVDFGPRVPGTAAHDQCLKFLAAELAKYTDKVLLQHFETDISGKHLPMTNIIAYTNANAPRQIMLAAHWDSRPTADQEINPQNRDLPIPGANDGASGVAVLLELARVFAAKRPDVGVVFVLFDGEDYGPGEKNMYLGAKYFARNIKSSLNIAGKQLHADFGILLDMVGDKDLNIYKEAYSVRIAPELVQHIWETAKKLGYSKEFTDTQKYSITDDHLPISRAGLPCIDIIDFDYGYWHTLDDTTDKCSAKSLKTVGDVISAYIYSLK